MKGYSVSQLDSEVRLRMSPSLRMLYERVCGVDAVQMKLWVHLWACSWVRSVAHAEHALS